MTLEGKTALVVGFAGAIGSSIATSLANAGCDIIGDDKAKQDSVQISIDKIKKRVNMMLHFLNATFKKKKISKGFSKN